VDNRPGRGRLTLCDFPARYKGRSCGAAVFRAREVLIGAVVGASSWPALAPPPLPDEPPDLPEEFERGGVRAYLAQRLLQRSRRRSGAASTSGGRATRSRSARALEEAKVRNLDERRQAFLARASVAKNEKPTWLALHDLLFDAVVAGLPPREDRDLDASLFPASSARTCGHRSPAPVRRPGRRTSPRTGCVSGADRSSANRAIRSPRSASGSGTRRS
jgi:hypothetical protein